MVLNNIRIIYNLNMNTCGFSWENLIVSIAAVVVFNLLTPIVSKRIGNYWVRWIITFALTCLIVLLPYAIVIKLIE